MPDSQALTVESKAEARSAGLQYVTDQMPGIRRAGSSNAFYYLDADGKHVKDEAVLTRIARLVLPPAWTEVWIANRQ